MAPKGRSPAPPGADTRTYRAAYGQPKIASICPLCAKLHHPNRKNTEVMNIYSQLSLKSNPLSYLLHFMKYPYYIIMYLLHVVVIYAVVVVLTKVS